MRLRFTPRATADLEDIADYINARDPAAALRVRKAILDTVKAVADFPAIGRAQNIDDVRKIATRRFPYLIYYLIDEASDLVVVLDYTTRGTRAHCR